MFEKAQIEIYDLKLNDIIVTSYDPGEDGVLVPMLDGYDE